MTNTQTITLTEHSGDTGISDHDLAVLADWAGRQKQMIASPDWKRAYSHIREGADLLLRRRARAKEEDANLIKNLTTKPKEK